MSQTSTRLSLWPFSLSVTAVEVELLSAGLLMFTPMGLTQCENPSEMKSSHENVLTPSLSDFFLFFPFLAGFYLILLCES